MSIENPADEEMFHALVTNGTQETAMVYAGSILLNGFLMPYAQKVEPLPATFFATFAESEDAYFGYGLAVSEPVIRPSDDGEELRAPLNYIVVNRSEGRQERAVHFYFGGLLNAIQNKNEGSSEDLTEGWSDHEDLDVTDWQMIATVFYHILKGKVPADRTTHMAIGNELLDIGAALEVDERAFLTLLMEGADSEKLGPEFYAFCERLFERNGSARALSLKREDADNGTTYWFRAIQVPELGEAEPYFIINASIAKVNEDTPLNVATMVKPDQLTFGPHPGLTSPAAGAKLRQLIPQMTLALMRAKEVDYDELPEPLQVDRSIDLAELDKLHEWGYGHPRGVHLHDQIPNLHGHARVEPSGQLDPWALPAQEARIASSLGLEVNASIKKILDQDEDPEVLREFLLNRLAPPS
jgi:hypothetical protein